MLASGKSASDSSCATDDRLCERPPLCLSSRFFIRARVDCKPIAFLDARVHQLTPSRSFQALGKADARLLDFGGHRHRCRDTHQQSCPHPSRQRDLAAYEHSRPLPLRRRSRLCWWYCQRGSRWRALCRVSCSLPQRLNAYTSLDVVPIVSAERPYGQP